MTLVEVTVDGANNIGEEVPEEWEEIEFLVDSGAGTTVVGPECVKAVEASDPDPRNHYTLANGADIPHMGEKKFMGLTSKCWTSKGTGKMLTAQVTDVQKPLLSVSQIVSKGGTVGFEQRQGLH